MGTLTLAERKERRALAKATIADLKKAARAHGWINARDSFFKEHDGWFVEIHVTVSPWERTTGVAMRLKPMAVDPMFWRIVGLPENSELPLSFRAFGAWVCGSPKIAEGKVEEGDGSPEAISGNLLEWVNSEMTRPLLGADYETYLDFLKGEGDGFFDNRMALLCEMGRHAEARTECLHAIRRNFGGGFEKIGSGGESVTFPMMVLDWIDR